MKHYCGALKTVHEISTDTAGICPVCHRAGLSLPDRYAEDRAATREILSTMTDDDHARMRANARGGHGLARVLRDARR